MADPERPLPHDSRRTCVVPTLDGRQMKTAERTDLDCVRMSSMGRMLPLAALRGSRAAAPDGRVVATGVGRARVQHEEHRLPTVGEGCVAGSRYR